MGECDRRLNCFRELKGSKADSLSTHYFLVTAGVNGMEEEVGRDFEANGVNEEKLSECDSTDDILCSLFESAFR